MIAFRRMSIEGDEENDPARITLPSPRREPLRPLPRNNNSKETLCEIITGHGKDEALLINSKPLLTIRQQAETEILADCNITKTGDKKTPLKTPSSRSISSPFTGVRTPNAGKILSPLPLLPRKLQQAKKKHVEVDKEEILSQVPCIQTPSKKRSDAGSTDFSAGDSGGGAYDLLKLRVSKPFDEDENEACDNCDDTGSLGWTYTLDDFIFVRKLGAGGSADVYEVLEQCSRNLYALKVQPATEDSLLELDIHIPLNHKNICHVVDYFYSDIKPFGDFDPLPTNPSQEPTKASYLCMILETCCYGDLHNLIDEQVNVPEDLAAKVMHDAINALRYLHSTGTIHCDIKPANWLVDGDIHENEAVIKLTDFGMAVSTDSREVVGGSPVYMAPEHLLAWRNLTNDFDHRTDIYSLGVVMYELLMGYLPYEVKEANHLQGHQNTKLKDLDESFAKELSGLSLTGPSRQNDASKNATTIEHEFPVLDLRNLNDAMSDQPFYIPPPIFVENVSYEAQDLILRLMEPSISKRITLEEAQEHEWFRKFGL
mmetsp:Transcript_23126/g.54676  ORF Transcript_23126/g.54676 Transcript_23126/m.54676 type:complete len:542 (-) Transcript_23126:200-1825(-)